jgi:hypothetical protein
MDFNLPEELQRRICFALIPAKSLCWPPKPRHYAPGGPVDNFPSRVLSASSAKLDEAARRFFSAGLQP